MVSQKQDINGTANITAILFLGLVLGLIFSSAVIVWQQPDQIVGYLLLMVSILCAALEPEASTNRGVQSNGDVPSPRHQSSTLIPTGVLIYIAASAATLVLLMPHLQQFLFVAPTNVTPSITLSALSETETIVWLAAYWLAATILNRRQHNQASIAVEDLSSTLDHDNVGIIFLNETGKIISANSLAQKIIFEQNAYTGGESSKTDTATKHTRKTIERIVGKTFKDIEGFSPWQIIESNTDRLDLGLAVQQEMSVIDKFGDARQFDCSIRQMPGMSDNHSIFTIHLYDKSAELKAKAKLEEDAIQLRRILAQGSDMVLFVTPKLNISFANNKACDTLNTENGQLIGQPIYNCIKTSDRSRFLQALNTFTESDLLDSKIPEMQLQGHEDISVGISVLRLSTSSNAAYAIIFKTSIAQLQSIQANKVASAKFSQVFHNSPDAILIIRASDELIVDFNNGFTRLLGYTREAAIGESGLDNTFWNNPVERAAVIEQLTNEREVIDHETTLRNAYGKLVHVEISLRYIEIDNELCILCIGRDITKRISAEAALFETEEKFEKIFNQSPDGILLLRQDDGVITDANDAALSRSGYSMDEVLGSSITTSPIFVSKGDLTEAASELYSNGSINNREVSVSHKDGSIVPTLISASAFELSGETHVMIISKDISKQRAAEERLRRSEERFRGIFENAPIGIMLLDIEGQIFQANHMAASLLAYDEQHMNGIHVSRLVPKTERESLKNNLTNMTFVKRTHKSEKRMICQDGTEIWVNFHVVLQKNSNNDPQYYIVQIADISDIKQSQQRMEQMAFYDTLTNLANRRLFHDRLTQSIEHCVRTNRSSALLYLDLDNFKRVNDTLGHQTGDHLLREVAARLKQCVRQEDTVGRTGGDEFTILLNEIASPSDAGLVAQKILNHLREPINISGHPLIVTTSIGITVVPSNGLDPNVLMQNADLAMYKAKERGRNNYQFYSDDLNVNAVKKFQTEYQIRQGLENEEFELYYQPKISIESGEIVGVESLIRWNHPERGLLFPDEFIPIAEDTGSIIDMGSWIIKTACLACQQISLQHGRNIQVAINISPRQFRDPNLITTVRRSLREANLNPENIEIEITETMLMQDVEAAQTTIERLAELGVNIAIDDFGTGYSSLNYLKRFPINTVKVDRSFVMDIPSNTDDMAITRAVIAMAHQLKMQVVAEGVETEEQLTFLAEHACEYAQGWLFSKAIQLPNLFDLLADERKKHKLVANDSATK